MNNEFESIWKEAVVAYFKEISRNSSVKIEKRHEKPHLGVPAEIQTEHFPSTSLKCYCLSKPRFS
jgi:hypothetical protein